MKSYDTGKTINAHRGSGGWGTWWTASSREPVWRRSGDWIAIAGVILFCLGYLALVLI